MHRNLLLVITVLALSLVMQTGISSAFSYQITYYMMGTSGTSILTNPVPFFSENGNVELTLNMRASFNTSAPFSYNGDFRSPYSIIFSLNGESLSQNFSCKNLGSPTKSYTTPQIIESRTTMTNDADSATIYSQSIFNVTTTDRYLRLFSYNNQDSEGYIPNAYRVIKNLGIIQEPPLISEITAELNSNHFSNCGDTGNLQRFPNNYALPGKQELAYVVFNSTAGYIEYSIKVGMVVTSQFVIYPIDNPSSAIDLGIGFSKSGNITLDQNRIYVIAYGTVGTYAISATASSFNITIDLGLPDYLCGDWSACIDGYHQRVCVDQNGLQPDRVEISPCEIVVLQNVTLGFEEYNTFNDVLRCYPTWVLGCYYGLENISVDRPLGWTVVDPAIGKQYFISMTSEWATEGSRSAKLWFIPPKEGEVDKVGLITGCYNTTSGKIPQIYKGVNDSYFLSYNVTFPATNMMLSFDTKKCNEQVRQHYGVQTILGIQLCPEQCYSQNCSTEPLGRYYFNIIDTNTSQSLLVTPYFGTAKEDTETLQFDLSGLGIVVNRTYNIVFAVYPENLHDTRGDCVMFDDVRYNVLRDPLITILEDECISKCIGVDYYKATELANGRCLIVKFPNYPDCSPYKEEILRKESYCVDSTLWFYDNKTAKYDTLDCEFGCKDGECMTQAEAEEEEEQATILTPNTYLAEALGEEYLNSIGMGWVLIFIVPMFIGFIIAIAIGVYVAKMSESFELGIISIMGILIVESLIPPPYALMPIWFVIVFIIVGGLTFAQFMTKRAKGD